jgi:hypothetical protein
MSFNAAEQNYSGVVLYSLQDVKIRIANFDKNTLWEISQMPNLKAAKPTNLAVVLYSLNDI